VRASPGMRFAGTNSTTAKSERSASRTIAVNCPDAPRTVSGAGFASTLSSSV
jgi:hypothetical protein